MNDIQAWSTFGFGYLLLVNILGWIMMHIDKKRAVRQQWRIPEKNLIGIAVAGGSLGVYLGMKTAHHKTRHKKFTVGIPVIIISQIALVVLIVEKIKIK